MTKIASTDRRVPEMIHDRVPFETHGALSAIAGTWIGTGRLNEHETIQWHADQAGSTIDHTLAYLDGGQPGIDYVVYSYATPIAWHTVDDRWHVVAQKFSRTTSSKHQSRLYLIPVNGRSRVAA